MFTGTYQHNIDAKGRIIMPTKLREELGQSFYVARGINSVTMGKGCLQVYPIDKWEQFLQKISELPSAQAQSLKRTLCSAAGLVEPNEQGRFCIPPNLRKVAGIEKEVVVIGAGDIVEIWSLENWDEMNDSQNDSEDLLALFNKI